MASFIGTTSTDPGVDLKTNNNVGIGTDTPAQKLDIRGGYAQIKSTSANAGVYLDAATDRDPFVDFKVNGSLKQNIFYDGDLNVMKICEQNTPVRIGNSNNSVCAFGKVGIGTTSPSTTLDVRSASGNAIVRITAPSASSPQLDMYEGANVRVVIGYAQSANQYGAGDTMGDTVIRAYQEDRYIRFGYCNGHVMSVGGSAGNVGVGTTNPLEKLEVVGKVKANNGSSDASLNIPVLSSDPANKTNGDIWLVSSGGSYYLRAYVNNGVRSVQLS